MYLCAKIHEQEDEKLWDFAREKGGTAQGCDTASLIAVFYLHDLIMYMTSVNATSEL